MSDVIVIGGGASGMLAAYGAALVGHRVTLIEKNEKLGKKIYITGKGRCNLTNDSEIENHMRQVVSNPKFLYSAYYAFGPDAIMELLESNGLPLKTERGNRVFPMSDHASDVTGTLQKILREYNVKIRLNISVKEILTDGQSVTGLKLSDGTILQTEAVILATGGLSYPTTGSDGFGLTEAKRLGHKIIAPLPSLTGLKLKEDYISLMQGLSLRNARLSVFDQDKCIYEDFGELLFTHYGISGPLALSACAFCNRLLQKKELSGKIDLKPALSEDQLDARILRDIDANINKSSKALIGGLVPKSMQPVLHQLSGISEEKKCNEITREDRHRLIALLKEFPITIIGTRDFNEAIITSGGIDVKEVNSSTMESKIINGLYFCGELLDLDALTGGYNLQIAWSTGYLAGISVS